MGCASQEKGHVERPRETRKGEEERAWRPSMGIRAASLDALETLGELPLNRYEN